MLGKYVKVKLSGKFGVVDWIFDWDGIIYLHIILNSFNTTLATPSEIDVIY